MDYKKLIAELIDINGVSKDELYELITLSKDANNGDYALPCFKFAKTMRKSPALIAQELKNSVRQDDNIKSVEAVNGYLNFTIDKVAFAKRTLDEVLREGDSYGASDEGNGKTVCIDYSSVNIAKPFHIGHLLNTSIGASLYRTFNKLGYKAVGINHLGDWGTQFGKLISAYKRWGDKEDIEIRGVDGLLEIYVKFHEEAEKDESLNDEARRYFKNIEDGDEEALELFRWFKEITMKEVMKVYDRLHVSFDSYNGEAFYNDKMTPVLDELEEKGLLVLSEGAKVVKFDGDEMPPCLLVRQDGATLYATRDMAAAFYRKRNYDFYKSLYVVAYQQNLHFRQVFKVVEMMGYDWAKDMVHVAHGMVSLEEGAMSSRHGKVVFVKDVLDTAVKKALKVIEEKNPNLEGKEDIAEKVGVGAVVFAMLASGRIKDIVFDYDKVLAFEGETAPYVQYTYARCCSLIEKASIGDNVDYSALDDPSAHEIVKLISRLKDSYREAVRRYEPSVMVRHVIDLAKAFNKFYFESRIIGAEEGVKNARLLLVKATKQVIKNELELLGIECPEHM